MPKQPRIPINTVTSGLNTPFAVLASAGLPAGEAVTATPTAAPAKPARRGRVVLRRETAQRAGKIVTVVDDFPPSISAAVIDELAGKLRQACGCGGTTRGRTIELQGDQPAKARALLEAEGFQVAGVR